MKKNISLLILIFTLIISGCSSSFITKTKNKNIKLKTFTRNGVLIGIENSKSKIYFNKNDLIDLYEYDVAQGEVGRTLELIYHVSSIEKDTIFNETNLKGTIPFLEYELKFHDLLKKGKAEVIWKESNEKLSKIKYLFKKDKLGGKSAYFLTIDGNELYNITLALGE